MENLLLQSATYTTGDTFGFYAAISLSVLMVLLILFVIYKYLDTSDLK